MKVYAGLIVAFWVTVLSPAAAWACSYPRAMQSLNTVMLDVLNSGGDVKNHHRVRLTRAMAQIDQVALVTTMASELSRRDMRAVRAVVGAAGKLVQGVGRTVDEDLRTSVMRVQDGVKATCVGPNVAAEIDGEKSTDAERGTDRNQGAGGRGLSFGEGVFRLSMTFAVYMVFLSCLLAIRRYFNNRLAALDRADHAAVQSVDDVSTAAGVVSPPLVPPIHTPK